MAGVLTYMLVLGMEMTHAQQVGNDGTIQNLTEGLSTRIGNEAVMGTSALQYAQHDGLVEPLSDFGLDMSHVTPTSTLTGSAHGGTNWLSFEFIHGAGMASTKRIRYERDMNDLVSIGGVAMFSFWSERNDEFEINRRNLRIGALLSARVYPLVIPFYFELGLGGEVVSRYLHDNWDDISDSRFEFTIAPAVGIRLGGPSGFFVNPFINFPIMFFNVWGDDVDARWTTINTRLGFGLGWAW